MKDISYTATNYFTRVKTEWEVTISTLIKNSCFYASVTTTNFWICESQKSAKINKIVFSLLTSSYELFPLRLTLNWLGRKDNRNALVRSSIKKSKKQTTVSRARTSYKASHKWQSKFRKSSSNFRKCCAVYRTPLFLLPAVKKINRQRKPSDVVNDSLFEFTLGHASVNTEFVNTVQLWKHSTPVC